VALGHTNAVPVLEQVIEELESPAARAGVSLRVAGDPEIDLPLRPRMLRVIADNLAVNAIRYAGHGATLTLSVLAAPTACDDCGLELESEDGEWFGGRWLCRDVPGCSNRKWASLGDGIPLADGLRRSGMEQRPGKPGLCCCGVRRAARVGSLATRPNDRRQEMAEKTEYVILRDAIASVSDGRESVEGAAWVECGKAAARGSDQGGADVPRQRHVAPRG